VKRQYVYTKNGIELFRTEEKPAILARSFKVSVTESVIDVATKTIEVKTSTKKNKE